MKFHTLTEGQASSFVTEFKEREKERVEQRKLAFCGLGQRKLTQSRWSRSRLGETEFMVPCDCSECRALRTTAKEHPYHVVWAENGAILFRPLAEMAQREVENGNPQET